MIKLIEVEINKYKCFQKAQKVHIDPSIPTIVGMNESGKSSFLTAVAKTNYFTTDPDFDFDIIHDYPRKELIDFQYEESDCDIISCKYKISSSLLQLIENEFGENTFSTKEFTYTCHYKSDSNTFGGISADIKKFLVFKVKDYSISPETLDIIKKSTSLDEIKHFFEGERKPSPADRLKF